MYSHQQTPASPLWGPATALAQDAAPTIGEVRWVTRLAMPAVSVAVAATAATASASSGFPASIYPPAVAAVPGHALALCPSRRGLEPFGPTATTLALQAAGSYDRRNLETDLRNSDRAWWPDVRQMWHTGHPEGGLSNSVVLGSEPTARSGFAVFMGPACGAFTLNRSLMVTVGPSHAGPGPHCAACNSHLFFVDRRGRPLIYFLY